MREDIIKMAREAGFADGVAEIMGLEGFARFAALVAAAEREACAKVCEQWEWANNAAAAIRARGKDPMPLFDDWDGGFPYKKEQK
jgi:hypothetical protein